MNDRRLAGAMILDRLDAEERATALKAVSHDGRQRPATFGRPMTTEGVNYSSASEPTTPAIGRLSCGIHTG